MGAAQATGFYRFEAKIISRGGGRSLVASAAYRTGGKSAASAAAYRAGVQLTDERTGISYDYTKKRGIMGAEIMLPNGAPAWMQDRAKLWNAVESSEKRKDAQTARDYLLSLPHQLSPEQRRALTKWFVAEQFTSKGYVADIAWHSPDSREGLNHHAHIMVTLRKVEGDGFARTKDRVPAGVHPMKAWKDDLLRLREAWALSANRFLQAAGLDIRVTHESLRSRNIEQEPDPKLGPIAMQMERNGRESHAGADRREVAARNAERAELKVELAKAVAEEAKLLDLVTHRVRHRSGDMKPATLTEHELRQQHSIEAETLQAMQAQDERLRLFKQQQAQLAEDAKRQQEQAEARNEARRRSDGDISSAQARYSLALADHYDVRDPYASLAKAAMSEYGAFVKEQERLRQLIAKEPDADKRRLLTLQKSIEGFEYMAVTSDRIAGLSATLVGREDAPKAILHYARGEYFAERATELRKERGDLLAQRIEQKREQEIGKGPTRSAMQGKEGPTRSASKRDPDELKENQTPAEQHPTPVSPSGRKAESLRTESKKARATEEQVTEKATGRTEGEAEVTDAAQARRDCLREHLTEGIASKNRQQKGIGLGRSQSH